MSLISPLVCKPIVLLRVPPLSKHFMECNDTFNRKSLLMELFSYSIKGSVPVSFFTISKIHKFIFKS